MEKTITFCVQFRQKGFCYENLSQNKQTLIRKFGTCTYTYAYSYTYDNLHMIIQGTAFKITLKLSFILIIY